MDKLKYFTDLITGSFDNKEQFEIMQKNEIDFPYARHVNTIINDRIKNLPKDFKGLFMLEENYYTVKDKTNSSCHIFLFTLENEDVKLDSYDIPEIFDKKSLNIQNLTDFPYEDLKKSKKFTPAIYKEKDGVFEGGSSSMFSPVLRFELHEKFSKDCLEVSESMYLNSKRTFGYDYPIIYKKIDI